MMRIKDMGIWLLILLFAGALASCGGDGGSSSPGTPFSGVASQGISEGVISSFGSITVNGVAFTTAGARLKLRDSGTEIELQNENEIRNHLREGEVVRVRGVSDDTTGRAAEIEFRDNMEARIDNKGVDFITVLGQRVFVDDQTRILDASGNASSLAALAVNDRVEVSGFPDDRGGLRAMFLMKKADEPEVEIKGFVLSAPSGGSFSLGLTRNSTSLTAVNFSGAALPNGTPVFGDLVEVKSTQGIVGGQLIASRVEREVEIEAAENEKLKLQGIVTSGAVADFFVNGSRRVQTNSQTRFKRGTAADFAPNIRVEVEGNMVGGILVATEIEFEDDVRINANVQGITTTSSTSGEITLQGFPAGKKVIVTSATEIRDGGSTLSLSLIGIGNNLEIRGFMDRNNANIIATRIDRRSVNPATTVFIQGLVTAKTPTSSLIILGLAISTGSVAEFRDVNENPVGATAFFSAVTVNTTVVKTRWNNFSSATNPVDRAELEDAS